jgi:hypothetical protein
MAVQRQRPANYDAPDLEVQGDRPNPRQVAFERLSLNNLHGRRYQSELITDCHADTSSAGVDAKQSTA